MVASKKIHCVICNKKCSGNVLRYQDQYYHKQCFEFDQSQEAAAAAISQQKQQQLRHQEEFNGAGSIVDEVDSQGINNNNNNNNSIYNVQNSSQTSILKQQQQQQQDIENNPSHSNYHSQSALLKSGGQATSYNQMTSALERSQTLQQQRATDNHQMKSQTIDARSSRSSCATGATPSALNNNNNNKSATLPHSSSVPANGFLQNNVKLTNCAGCKQKINDGQALIALDLHWHVWCFKCSQCQVPLHGEYVAKEGKAYCEKDYQKLFGVTCVYCKRYITGKVLQAGEAHHFHPSCARCSKCGDPFVPGEEMYLQGEVTWHPRCGPGPENHSSVGVGGAALDELMIANDSSSRSQLRASRNHSPSLSSRSQSRSASPFSFMSRQFGRSSPGYADSEAVGDLSRVYTISYLNADPTQGYLRRPIEPHAPKSPQFSRPTSVTRDRSRSSSRSHLPTSSSSHYYTHGAGSHLSRDRSVPRGMYSVLSSMSRSGSHQRAKSPSMMNEEAIHLAQYPSGQKPSPDAVPKIERDDFPAPPFPYTKQQQAGSTLGGVGGAATSGGASSDLIKEPKVSKQPQQQQQQQRSSRPKSREIIIPDDDISLSSDNGQIDADPRMRKEEEELSKIANGIGKIFLQTLKEREKLRAWKRANLDPRNASRTPSATRELPTRLRYDNPTNASPSRDMDRPRPWEEEEEAAAANATVANEHSPTRTRSSLGRQSQLSPSTYGYKVVQSNRSTPKPGYGVTAGPYDTLRTNGLSGSSTMTPTTTANPTHNGVSHHQHYHHQSQLMNSTHQQQHDFNQQNNRSSDLLARAAASTLQSELITPQNRSTLNGQNRQSSFGSPHLRRSMPNVNLNHLLHLGGPPKLYPYHLLATSNYRLPPDVDRCHLERHLSNEEFQYIFHCDRLDFYRLPEWKRNELKRRAKLF